VPSNHQSAISRIKSTILMDGMEKDAQRRLQPRKFKFSSLERQSFENCQGLSLGDTVEVVATKQLCLVRRISNDGQVFLSRLDGFPITGGYSPKAIRKKN
jgi:hypothetical protein